MAVHLLRNQAAEPADWASRLAIGEARIIPEWPASGRFALVAVVRNPGPDGEAHTRAMLVTTAEEMDRLLTNHTCRILWFTVAKYQITDDMIERTLNPEEKIV
jgi:hypothetical protein